jgi:hypothetical protein
MSIPVISDGLSGQKQDTMDFRKWHLLYCVDLPVPDDNPHYYDVHHMGGF